VPRLYNQASLPLRFLVAFALGVALPAPAHAGDPAPPTDPLAAFLEGEKAFEHGDYLDAARAFEAAYRASPHPDVLWNAARAWDHAGEPARAANLYARYLEEAPAGARDRDSAIQDLARLSAKLGRLDVVATGLGDVGVDDQPLRGARLYVTPGAHVVRGRAGDRAVVKTVTVAAGDAVSVALVDPPPAEPEKAAPPPTVILVPVATPAPAQPPRLLSRWQRVTVAAGAALTAASGAALIWSGVDTLQARSAFDHEATPQALDDGRARQARTNVLIGTTAGLGALTVGATIVFAALGRAEVQARAGLAVDPLGAPLAALAVRGRF
jgi:hypothetical protein